jgi:hypothetical protein
MRSGLKEFVMNQLEIGNICNGLLINGVNKWGERRPYQESETEE